MKPPSPRTHSPRTIDPRTGKHIAAPDSLWWTCTWIAAIVLAAPLLAWAAYTFWNGEFYLPSSRHPWARRGWITVTGVPAMLLSTTVLIAGVGMFLHAGVREIDQLRPIVDRVEPALIAIGAILLIVALAMVTIPWL